jgi:uncharacterized membrane protein
MDLSRAWRHLASTGWSLRRAFNREVLASIEQTIIETEEIHGGEICFAIEDNLSMRELWRGKSPRGRAVEVFARLGVWDTQANNGVLIFVLWADRSVEIVADRGLTGSIGPHEWRAVCERMEKLFAENRTSDAVVEGIRAVSALVAREFPVSDGDELPNRPVLL